MPSVLMFSGSGFSLFDVKPATFDCLAGECLTTMSYKPEKLRKIMGAANGPVIVDVRSKREYQQAHIPGAVHLSFWLMPFRFKTLEMYRTRDVVLYCEHGPRAVFARQTLQSKGFTKVDCLEGHMQAWRKLSFPLIQK